MANKLKKKWVVVSISEDGYASVYGPYGRTEAHDVMEEISMNDTSQKTYLEVQKLSKFNISDLE